jgi:hypothetical protein
MHFNEFMIVIVIVMPTEWERVLLPIYSANLTLIFPFFSALILSPNTCPWAVGATYWRPVAPQ